MAICFGKRNNQRGFQLGEYLEVKFPASLHRHIDYFVIVQCFLLANGERHPHCFVERTSGIDPVKWSALKIQYSTDTLGRRQACWLRYAGDQTAQKVNSVLDRMDDIPGHISPATP